MAATRTYTGVGSGDSVAGIKHALGGVLLLADDGTNHWLYRNHSGIWSPAIRLSTVRSSDSNVIQKTAGAHFIHSNNTLYKSTDKGVTWTESASGLTDLDLGVENLSLDGIGSTFYTFRYGAAGHYQLWKSTDSGATWALAQDITDTDFVGSDTLQIAVNPNDATEVIFMGLNAARTQIAVGVSSNSLTSYTKHTITPSVTVGTLLEYGILKYTADASRIVMMHDLFASSPGKFGAYYSDDTGATWTEVVNDVVAPKQEFGGSDPELGPLLSHVGGLMFAGGNYANNLSGGGILGVWMSQDAGATWTELESIPADWATNPAANNRGGRIIYDPVEDNLWAWNEFGAPPPYVFKMANPTSGSSHWADATPSDFADNGFFTVSGQALALA